MNCDHNSENIYGDEQNKYIWARTVSLVRMHNAKQQTGFYYPKFLMSHMS